MAEKKNTSEHYYLKKKSPSYLELFFKAMELWRVHHAENYAVEYEKLLSARQQLRLTTKERLKKSLIKKYSKGTFLSVQDEAEAKRFLFPMTDQQVQSVIDEINRYLSSDERKILRSYVEDFSYEVRRAKMPKDRLKYGINPSACSGNGRRASSYRYSDSI